jgi:hypothetical protein
VQASSVLTFLAKARDVIAYLIVTLSLPRIPQAG